MKRDFKDISPGHEKQDREEPMMKRTSEVVNKGEPLEQDSTEYVEQAIKSKKSKATRINTLLTKQKAFIGSIEKLVPFKEPVLQLIRNNGDVTWHENATSGVFEFEHSNGNDAKIILDPSYIKRFHYAGGVFRGYIADEDSGLPWDRRVRLDAVSLNNFTNNMFEARAKWEAQLQKAKGNKIYTIAFGIAIVIGVLILGRMLIGDSFTLFGFFSGPEGEAVKEGAKTAANAAADAVVRNVTKMG